MGAVSLAQRSGVLGSGIYATQKPNIDVAGAIGAISQALSAQREGAIQRAYLQHQTARQKELDDRALQQQLYERDFQGKQLAQQQALAQGQHDIESRRIESDADLKRQEMAAAAETKRQQLQMMKEIAQLRAKATTDAAATRGKAEVTAAGTRAGKGAESGTAAAPAGNVGAAQKAYQGFVKELMAPRLVHGVKSNGMPADSAMAGARAMTRDAYPDEALHLWGTDSAPAPTAPLNTTQAAEAELTSAYRQAYQALDPKDPQYSQKKATLDQHLQARLSMVHSRPPQPLPTQAPGAPTTGALPSGDPSDNDQEP